MVLDRGMNKRCDFLSLTKSYKTQEGNYEKIFWRTQKALKASRPRAKLSAHRTRQLRVAIDTSERYSWRFSGCAVVRGEDLRRGYALFGNQGELPAVVKRKSLENLLSGLGDFSALHQRMSELLSSSLMSPWFWVQILELLNPANMKFYGPSFAAGAVGEILAMHPGLPLVFAGNRKPAQQWPLRFFNAILAHQRDLRPAPGGAGPGGIEEYRRKVPERSETSPVLPRWGKLGVRGLCLDPGSA